MRSLSFDQPDYYRICYQYILFDLDGFCL